MTKMRTKLLLIVLCLGLMEAHAQVFEVAEDGNLTDGKATENVVVNDGFWKHWFVQMGLDMTLQNPYGYDLSKVFPNGKSFGLELAVGKWFSHQVGVRGKFNWENALPLLENDHAKDEGKGWLCGFIFR